MENKQTNQDPRTKVVTLSRDKAMILAGMMSDMQELLSGEFGEMDEGRKKSMRGKLNLIKGVLFDRIEMVSEDNFFFEFKSKSENSRFCDKCGLIKEGEYKECECREEAK